MGARKIVKIDEDLCTGCGQCVPARAEGAIRIVDGVARLVADNLCDGLGACLGDCPEGAISIEERDADDFDEAAVEAHAADLGETPPKVDLGSPAHTHGPHAGGCPGARVIQFGKPAAAAAAAPPAAGDAGIDPAPRPSELRQWPIQLHLLPPTAPYFKKADVILAADCVAFSIGDFHRDHLKGKGLAIACPKLDDGQEMYLTKLVAMIDEAEINTLTVMIMEVPCCGGLVRLAREATARARRKVPVKQVVVSLRGEILKEEWI